MAVLALQEGATSPLFAASEQIATVIDTWLANYKETKTRIHAGKVTPQFLFEQGLKAPWAAVTSLSGSTKKVGGGKGIISVRRWMVFFVVAGTLVDRTRKLDLFVSEFTKLVFVSPWYDRQQTPESRFTKWPDHDSVSDASLWTNDDERGSGHSVWTVEWDQEVDLGPAGEYVGEPWPSKNLQPLALIEGTSIVPGEPNNDTEAIKLEVP